MKEVSLFLFNLFLFLFFYSHYNFVGFSNFILIGQKVSHEKLNFLSLNSLFASFFLDKTKATLSIKD